MSDMQCEELAGQMRAAVFAGRNMLLAPAHVARQQFGVSLLVVLCAGLRIDERCALHAMLLWTMSIATSARGGDMDVCVACLMVCAKMHESSVNYGLSAFSGACEKVFESREATVRAVEAALEQEPPHADEVHFQTTILKMFESAALVREVQRVSAQHVRYAELFLLFKSMHGMWHRYLIELYDYILAKTDGLPREVRMRVVTEICRVPTH